MKMAAPGFCHLLAVLLITLSQTSYSSEIPSENAKKCLIGSTPSDSKQDQDMGLLGSSQRRRFWTRKDRDSIGLHSQRPLDQPEDDGTSLEGLSPVRLEMGPGDSMRTEVHEEVRGPAHMRRGNPPPEGELNRKGRRHGHGHQADHRKQEGKRDKGRAKGNEICFSIFPMQKGQRNHTGASGNSCFLRVQSLQQPTKTSFGYHQKIANY